MFPFFPKHSFIDFWYFLIQVVLILCQEYLFKVLDPTVDVWGGLAFVLGGVTIFLRFGCLGLFQVGVLVLGF